MKKKMRHYVFYGLGDNKARIYLKTQDIEDVKTVEEKFGVKLIEICPIAAFFASNWYYLLGLIVHRALI